MDLLLDRTRTAMPSGVLRAQLVPVFALDAETRTAMWRLYDRSYTGVRRGRFDMDLSAKEQVILLRDAGDRSLQGFSTVQRYQRRIQGRHARIVYSGDTVLSRGYWGQRALQRCFSALLIREKLKAPHSRVYWFLISKGYKTYLLLARNFPDFWPRAGVATPPFEAALIDGLAQEKFGNVWDRSRGVLAGGEDAPRLRAEVAPLDPAGETDPDIRFFAARNPGHARGDELACLGQVNLRLCLAATRKFFLGGGRRC
jgi:hypothetical protein